MSFSSNNLSNLLEPNTTNLSMFASVGFHAVLFMAMALVPATSQTPKKPLRIVNLTPRSANSPATTQATTSSLDQIRKNFSLPDLSQYPKPPLGKTSLGLGDTNYVSSDFNSANLDKTGLRPTTAPKPSFLSSGIGASGNGSLDTSSLGVNPDASNLKPAPRGPTPANITPPSPQNNLPPSLQGGAPSPVPPTFSNGTREASNSSSPPSSNSSSASNDPIAFQDDTQRQPTLKEARSQVRTIAVKSVSLNPSYPLLACDTREQGSVEIEFYQNPQGQHSEGSLEITKHSGSPILDQTATDAVISYVGPPTGDYQKYFSRVDFVYSDATCVSAKKSSPPAVLKAIPAPKSPAQSPTQPSTQPPTPLPSSTAPKLPPANTPRLQNNPTLQPLPQSSSPPTVSPQVAPSAPQNTAQPSSVDQPPLPATPSTQIPPITPQPSSDQSSQAQDLLPLDSSSQQ